MKLPPFLLGVGLKYHQGMTMEKGHSPPSSIPILPSLINRLLRLINLTLAMQDHRYQFELQCLKLYGIV